MYFSDWVLRYQP